MPNTKLKLKIFFLGTLFFSIFGLTKNASAGNYYVDKDSIGGTCNNSNAGTSITAPWCSISRANSNLIAGDTAYLRAGSYAEQINPARNGSSGNPITYVKYQSETVNITYVSSNPQANLVSKSYITIDGLNFLNATGSWINLETGGSYCIIQNCYFSGASTFAGINLYNRSNYNKILNNTFDADNCTMTYASQVAPNAGYIYATQAYAEDASYCPGDHIYMSNSSYNLIEGNTFLNATHGGLDIVTGHSGSGGDRNIVRGNEFKNYWHSNFILYSLNHTAKNLVENNIIHDAGITAATENPFYVWRGWTGYTRGSGIQAGDGGYNQIIRNNVLYNNGVNGLSAYTTGSETKYSKWYNNTIYGNVYNFQINCSYECSGNLFKNNSITSTSATAYGVVGDFSNVAWLNYFTNNNVYGTSNRYKTASGTVANITAAYSSEWSNNLNANPLYTDAAAYDFSLTSSSPNIDAGGWLTTITSASGSGTSFVVADSGYFFDGWGISGEVGDTIQLQGQTATARISGIDYATHSITINSPLAWTQGMGVALVYSGSAPDIGAYEYQSSGDTTSPSAPQGLAVE